MPTLNKLHLSLDLQHGFDSQHIPYVIYTSFMWLIFRLSGRRGSGLVRDNSGGSGLVNNNLFREDSTTLAGCYRPLLMPKIFS